MSGIDDTETTGRQNHSAPYTPHHQIPTVQKYREEKQEREEAYGAPQEEQEATPSKTERIGEAWNTLLHGEDDKSAPDGSSQPYLAENKNFARDEDAADDQKEDGDAQPEVPHQEEDGAAQQEDPNRPKQQQNGGQNGEEGREDNNEHVAEDTTEGMLSEANPKKARKAMKKFSADGTEREVTDPVTHLPVTIHDFTNEDLKKTPKNAPPAGSQPRSATGAAGMNKSEEELHKEQSETEESHESMQMLFPPPDFAMTREQITEVYRMAMTAGLGLVAVALTGVFLLFQVTRNSTGMSRVVSSTLEVAASLGVSAGVIVGLRQWTENKIKGVWETEVWQAESQQGKKAEKSRTAESAQWLNSLLASIWPLVNPDLFTSLADTLEDVMQASLPRMVRMVSVDDIGQGSESMRILGVRWLPTGAAAKSVSQDGHLKSSEGQNSDRIVQGEGEVQNDDSNNNEDSQDQDGNEQKEQSEQVSEGMEAEEGDFVNMEIAFAYRPSTGRRGMRSRAKNAHLYLAFYLPSNIKVPVWVELHGIIGVVRLRLQLTPDPPFFSLCTLTFLGQPKVDVSCIPLIKQGPNLMDLPLISRFVQSSVDAAMAEYVAPKSLTLDLKDMLVGDDFKKDTGARGVLIITIKRAFDFKEGDAGVGPLKNGSADPYVSVGWAKFGKPMWSTRILQSNMEPYWQETTFLLVTPEELNVDENLRVQLWDSDRTTADDDLGRIELPVKGLMRGEETNGKIQNRQDGFKALKKGEGMPGKLEWSVGYFSKQRITNDQLKRQTEDPDVKTMDQLKKKVYAESERKLREASKDESDEIQQQKAQDLKTRQDELIISSPPPQDYPSGIISIQIHNITGLELEAINKNKALKNEGASDEVEEGDDLPSAYCTVILNHQKVFKTRTKPKNSKPFFNAGTERFVRDWRNTEIHISVRDARVHEDDPLLGVIYLPLAKLLEKRSQINDFFPIAGGVGYGRARISIVFRAVQLQAPKQMLGWEYGTLEIQPKIKNVDVAQDLQGMRMKIRTTLARAKLNSIEGGWEVKKGHAVRLPVRKRYASPLVVEFRKDKTLADRTPAFCILWLKDVPDNEEQTITLPVWKGDLKRAEHNVMDEYGEPLGKIELTMTFWSGLSGYHGGLSKKDGHVGDVMEVLDTCQDNDEDDWNDGSQQDEEPGSDASDSDSSFIPSILRPSTDSSLESDGKRGTIDQMKDYKQNAKQLHRKNRGAMQWKGPRTLAWMKHSAEKAKGKAESLVKHNERGGDQIETEV